MQKRMSRRNYILIYTVLFALFCAGAFIIFPAKGKSMVWNQDGGPQYLPYLAYMGQYLRDFLSRAVHGDFTLRMFDWRIGFGSDVSAVVRAHPLDFLSVFVPVRYTGILYHFITLARLYLAGLCFSLFCSMFRDLSLTMMTGSLIYVFSGFVFSYAIEHPIYGSALIMLALLLAGAERMMRREGIHLFAFAVFLGFICNYYFMYESTIALLLYILLRFPMIYTRDRVKNFFILFVRMAPVYLLGTGMSMITLWPVIKNLGASARLAQQPSPGNLLSYESPRIFYQWFLFLVSPGKGLPGGTHLNYSVLIIPALVLLFTQRKKGNAALKCAFAAGTVFLLIPFFGYVMAGFSTVNNRWVFIYSFIVSFIFVLYAPDAAFAKRAQKITMAVVLAVFTALAIMEFVTFGRLQGIVGTILLAAASLCMFAGGERKSLWKGRTFLLQGFMLAVTFVSCTANAYFEYSPRFGNAISEYLDAGTGLAVIEQSEFSKIARIEDPGFWRADSNLINSNRENYSLLLNYNPTSMYNSVLSGPLTYVLLEQDNIGLAAIHRIQGLDGHTAAEERACVKYFLTSADGYPHAPYGFTYSETLSDRDNAIFVNENPLAFGVLHKNWMDLPEYEKLNALQKEQAALDAAVVDANQLTQEQAAAMQPLDQVQSVEEQSVALPEKGSHVKKTDGGYRITKKGGYIEFPIQLKAGCEAYLRLEGFTNSRVSTYVGVRTTRMFTQVLMRGPGTLYSLNRTDYNIRLGYSETDQADIVRLEFTDKGIYTLDAIKVCYVPIAGYEEKIAALNSEALKDPVFGINKVSGSASTQNAGIMVFSIPYSQGWSATVDGKQTKVLQANTAWTGIYLEPGEHQIEFSYCTPGAVAGRWIAGICWLLFFCLIILRRKLHL